MRPALLTILLLAAAGCGRQEEARHYRAPKDPTWRMLGAIAPVGGATWFFKLVAPADRIDPVKADVLKFFGTLRSEAGQVRWTAPAGWVEEKGNAQREATLKFGSEEPKFEVTISRLQGDGGGLLANVNRWRDQLGLEPVAEPALAVVAKKLDGIAFDVWVLDLRGPNRPAGGPRGMMAKPAEPEPPARGQAPTIDDIRAMFSFERPAGWKENPQPTQGRLFEFTADGSAGPALITLSALQGGGDLVGNVNRWRNQVGLEPLSEADVSKSAAPVTFIGADAWLVEAIGSSSGIVVIASLNSEFSIFFKMTGPPSTVQEQKDAFMKVAQTFKMKGRHD
jgi:hypothetical protein